jgi:hypothetical protein
MIKASAQEDEGCFRRTDENIKILSEITFGLRPTYSPMFRIQISLFSI